MKPLPSLTKNLNNLNPISMPNLPLAPSLSKPNPPPNLVYDPLYQKLTTPPPNHISPNHISPNPVNSRMTNINQESEEEEVSEDTPNSKKEFKPKANKIEIKLRINRTIDLLSQFNTVKTIFKLQKEFDVKKRQAYNYVLRARKEMLQCLGTTREQERSRVYHMLLAIATKEDAKDSDRLRSLHLLMGLLGLRPPMQYEVQASSAPLVPPELQQSLLINPLLIEALQRVDELSNPIPIPPPLDKEIEP